MDIAFQVRSGIAAISLLNKRLGVLATTSVLGALMFRQVKGQPWRGLPSPADEKEKLTREQAGPAILLYRVLCDRMPQQDALDLTADIATEGALIFLRQTIPTIRAAEMNALSDEQRLEFLQGIQGKFFNADAGDYTIGETDFSFLIQRCRFPELCKATGHPELAPVFCKGDGLFFERHQPEVLFSREHTLARDGQPCDFSFQLKD